MAFDRKEYQRIYMRERRAAQLAAQGKAVVRTDMMRDRLEAIIKRLDGNDKPLAAELRRLAQEGLGEWLTKA